MSAKKKISNAITVIAGELFYPVMLAGVGFAACCAAILAELLLIGLINLCLA